MDVSSQSLAARLAAAQALTGSSSAAATTVAGTTGAVGDPSASPTEMTMPKTAAEAQAMAAQFIAQMQQAASSIGAEDDDDDSGDDDGISMPGLPTDAAGFAAQYGTTGATSSALASISALASQSGLSAASLSKLAALTSSGTAQGNDVLAALTSVSGRNQAAGGNSLLNAPVATAAGPRSGSAGANAKTVADVAAKHGVDPALAVAMMLVESGGNASAVGDGGTSFGLFQLHEGGMLTAAKLSPQQAFDPATNANVAIASLASTRRSMSSSSTPGQVAAASQRPADRVGYAAKVDASMTRARQLLGLPSA